MPCQYCNVTPQYRTCLIAYNLGEIAHHAPTVGRQSQPKAFQLFRGCNRGGIFLGGHRAFEHAYPWTGSNLRAGLLEDF